MTCEICTHWTRTRARRYADGTEIETYAAPKGKGRCDLLQIDTAPEFGCASFVEGANSAKIEHIGGASWQHWKMGSCPDCEGRGCTVDGGVCIRCAGTSKVRYYDDGHVGEEATRRHPKEPVEEPVVDPGTILVPMPKPDVLHA